MVCAWLPITLLPTSLWGLVAGLLAFDFALQAAHDKDMTVVALTGLDAGSVAERLSESDVCITVPHERAARILEVHAVALHCLCDAVDLQLLGEQEPK